MDIIIISLLIVNLIVTFSVYYKLDKKDDNNKRKVVQKINGNGNIQSVNTVKVDYKELRKIK